MSVGRGGTCSAGEPIQDPRRHDVKGPGKRMVTEAGISSGVGSRARAVSPTGPSVPEQLPDSLGKELGRRNLSLGRRNHGKSFVRSFLRGRPLNLP